MTNKKTICNHLLKMAMEKAMLNSVATTDYGIKKYHIVAMTEEKNGLLRVVAKHKPVGDYGYNLSVFNVYIHMNTLSIDALWDGDAVIGSCIRQPEPKILASFVSYGDFTSENAIQWIRDNVLPNWHGNEKFEC